MVSKTSASRSVRLRNETWEAIDQAAAELGMNRNEYLSRRLTAAHPVAHEIRNSGNIASISDHAAEAPEDALAAPLAD